MIIAGFVIAAIALLALLIIDLIISFSEDGDFKEGFGFALISGWLKILLIMALIGTGLEIWPRNPKYYNKYKWKNADVECYQVDTTFTITNNQTDTTYTIYYNDRTGSAKKTK